jgi:carbamoyltransferase
MKSILGISAGFHDASASVIDTNGDILFAGHSERYSGIKHDANICPALLDDVAQYDIDTIAYYERPWNKQLRQLYSGQGIEWDKLTAKQILNTQLGKNFVNNKKIKTYSHHLSHAAAGFQTSPFNEATIVVIDAIGEWDTTSIWYAKYDSKGNAQYKKLWRQIYPHSIGLLYSAFTKHVGLRPLDEEYILMGMAGWGKDKWMHNHRLATWLGFGHPTIKSKYNMHIGLPTNIPASIANLSEFDFAAGAQDLTEALINRVIHKASRYGDNNLVYMGGVALNCLANRQLGPKFDNIWIMPNPGDAGSSLGAAALAYGKKLNWQDAYLGHNIPGQYPVKELLNELVTNKIVGVASGPAEFGPRALGNRSLLADPRGPEIKDKVNEIKRRQQFRPFAPVILEEYADEYFNMPSGFKTSPYMQAVATCLHPDLFPAIIHVDGTSRVQTVPKDCKSGIRQLLEAWHVWTGCPMLLNTSLNIRGEPMVNNRSDADRFEKLYGIKVLS